MYLGKLLVAAYFAYPGFIIYVAQTIKVTNKSSVNSADSTIVKCFNQAVYLRHLVAHHHFFLLSAVICKLRSNNRSLFLFILTNRLYQ